MANSSGDDKNTPSISRPTLPSIVFAHASVLSIGGASLLSSTGVINSQNVQNFFSESYLVARAVEMLRAAGFTILHVTGITISIGAPPSVYNTAFSTTLRTEELPVIKARGRESTATFIRADDTNTPGTIDVSKTRFREVLEGVSINEPVYFMGSFLPPKKSYWHLSVPGDVSAALGADPAHRMAVTGLGVHAVMVDTGWYAHPYFLRRGYRSAPVILGPIAQNPHSDEVGHGTGESANMFAVAPDLNFQMVKMSFVESAGAFNAAVATAPDVISCSWGSSKRFGPLSGNDLVLSAAIANAVAHGITVVFSAGNGHFGFPRQHPDVISAGGAYVDENLQLTASDYSSGFQSNIYPGRIVPDVCGLVGMLPAATYIMLPVQPGDEIDVDGSGEKYPDRDETKPDDGWAAFSGTSAAAPQIAGVVALMKQVNPLLSPYQIRAILQYTAIDVKAGNAHPATGKNVASEGQDLATGFGLVNAQAAVIAAMNTHLQLFT